MDRRRRGAAGSLPLWIGRSARGANGRREGRAGGRGGRQVLRPLRHPLVEYRGSGVDRRGTRRRIEELEDDKRALSTLVHKGGEKGAKSRRARRARLSWTWARMRQSRAPGRSRPSARGTGPSARRQRPKRPQCSATWPRPRPCLRSRPAGGSRRRGRLEEGAPASGCRSPAQHVHVPVVVGGGGGGGGGGGLCSTRNCRRRCRRGV